MLTDTILVLPFSYSPFSSSPYSLLSPRQGRPRVVHCSLLLFVTSPISPLSLLPGSGAAALPVTNVAKTQKKKKHTSTRDHHAPRTAPQKGTHCASRANSEGWTPATFWLAFPFRHKKRRSINRKVTTMREDIYTKMFNPPWGLEFVRLRNFQFATVGSPCCPLVLCLTFPRVFHFFFFSTLVWFWFIGPLFQHFLVSLWICFNSLLLAQNRLIA